MEDVDLFHNSNESSTDYDIGEHTGIKYTDILPEDPRYPKSFEDLTIMNIKWLEGHIEHIATWGGRMKVDEKPLTQLLVVLNKAGLLTRDASPSVTRVESASEGKGQKWEYEPYLEAYCKEDVYLKLAGYRWPSSIDFDGEPVICGGLHGPLKQEVEECHEVSFMGRSDCVAEFWPTICEAVGIDRRTGTDAAIELEKWQRTEEGKRFYKDDQAWRDAMYQIGEKLSIETIAEFRRTRK
ncbi:hypothetical protein NA57DRAFT_71070 [Rhizodiscina lignyota]|uniref:Uncharacterized protein n=1 Tax=Rhizodiscina lignyota TaxID=1504668 RepID=A0A9P4IUV8_9PEZI|nr:hypothetical protein NA57DRAFT_71070 [Rhizodiscina lignyota]